MIPALKKDHLEKTVNVRVTETERSLIEKLARKYAGGNISAWMRHAALKFKPEK